MTEGGARRIIQNLGGGSRTAENLVRKYDIVAKAHLARADLCTLRLTARCSKVSLNEGNL